MNVQKITTVDFENCSQKKRQQLVQMNTRKKKTKKGGDKDKEQVILMKNGWSEIHNDGIKPFLDRLNIVVFGDDDYDGVGDFFMSCHHQYIRTYDTIFTMCIQREPYNYSSELYQKYNQVFDDYFKNTLAENLEKSKEEQHLISFLIKWWQTWKLGALAIAGIKRFFMFLDRFYSPQTDDAYTIEHNGYISFYCDVFQTYTCHAKYCILRLIEMARTQSTNDYDMIITDALRVYSEIDDAFMKYNIKLKQLKFDTLHIADMNVIIDGYFREMEPEIIMPLEIITICKTFYGNLEAFHLLQQCILYDLTQQTLDYYKLQSMQWLKLGVRQYFIKCDKAINEEGYNLCKWITSRYSKQIVMSISMTLFEDKQGINQLFDGICSYHISNLFDLYLGLTHHLVRDELLSRIIRISSKLFGFDVKLLIDNFIDRKTCIPRVVSLKEFLNATFANNKKKIIAFMIQIYFHGKFENKLISFKIEKPRKNRIVCRINDMMYSE